MDKSRSNPILFDNPRIVPKMVVEKSDDPTTLAEQSLTFFFDGSLDTFAKLLVLEFFLPSIYLQRMDYYGPLIYPDPDLLDKQIVRYSLTKNPHLQVPLGLFEPRLSANSKEAFKEIEDAEGILRSVNNLVDSIECVLKALPSKNLEKSNGENYRKRIQQLKGLCSERRNNADRALQALNRQLDYLTKRHAIRESKAIKTLTILASIYLPLSLSASILGMQSPFKAIAHDSTSSPQDLTGTNLLFDFFGVFIGLSSGTIFILYGIRLGLWAKSTGLGMLSKQFSGQFSILHYGRRWRYGGRSGNVFEVIRVSTAWWIGAGFCITLLTIFLVGMLRTAQSAWDTARWMFATYCIVSGVLFGLYFGTYWFLHLKNIRGW